jgi:hypothetical protein
MSSSLGCGAPPSVSTRHTRTPRVSESVRTPCDDTRTEPRRSTMDDAARRVECGEATSFRVVPDSGPSGVDEAPEFGAAPSLAVASLPSRLHSRRHTAIAVHRARTTAAAQVETAALGTLSVLNPHRRLSGRVLDARPNQRALGETDGSLERRHRTLGQRTSARRATWPPAHLAVSPRHV